MLAIGFGSRWLDVALTLALGVAVSAANGCGQSSGVVEKELSASAKKTVFEKRVDVKSAASARRESKIPGAKGRDRRP
jgi:hypothetical protein